MLTIEDLYRRYNEDLRPLVSEIEGRLETFEEPLLENIAFQFDYVALSEVTGNSEYISQAEVYLNRAISNSYLYLIYALMRKVKTFKKRGGFKVIERDRRTNDAAKFKECEERAVLLSKRGLNNPDELALEDNKQAYEACIELEKYVEEYSVNLLNTPHHVSRSIVAGVLSILISVLVGYWATKMMSGWL